GYHHGGIAVGPVAAVVGEIEARDPGRAVHRVDVEPRRRLYRALHSSRQPRLAQPPDDRDEVTGRGIDEPQERMWKSLAARHVAEVADHLERDHPAHDGALALQRLGVAVAAHPARVVIR